MKKQNRLKMFSLILAVVMLVSSVPISAVRAENSEYPSEEWFKEHFEEINQNGYFCEDTASLYRNPVTSPEDKIEVSKDSLPEAFVVQYKYTEDNGTMWYMLDTENWDTQYSEYGYVLAQCVSIVTTEGDIPEDVSLKLSGVTDEQSSAIQNSIINYSAFKNCHTVNFQDVDLKFVGRDENSQEYEWQPEKDAPVAVTVTNVWDTTLNEPIVDVYHILDTKEAIEDAKDSENFFTSTSADLLAAYPNEAALAKETLSLDSEAVPYVLLTTRNDSVLFNEDGSVTFETDSFSDFWFASGATNSTTSITSGSHTIYIAPGYSGTLTVADSDVTLSTTTPAAGITVGTTAESNSTTVSVSADADNAVIGTESTFTLTWKTTQNQNKPNKPGTSSETTYTATITVIVVDEDDYEKYKYLDNSIKHIQVDIEASAVILGYNNDASTAVDLNFTSSTNYTLTRVIDDDSEVGYYYQLVYGDVTITVRIDETQEYPIYPTTFEITGISIEDGQISFNGTFPVGTQDNPVKYSVTVETTLSLTPNDKTLAEDVDVTLSDTIGYWDSDNECPGLGHNKTDWETGSVINGSGIDLSKFQTGAVLGENTVYVVFSGLTKIVEGYTFSSEETASRNFVFTIYRRAKGSTDAWVAFDTITVTANSATTTTTINAEASKYDVKNIANYEFKIVETGNSISGYTCTDVIKINGETSTDNVFTWTETKDTTNKTITYSVQITCTNTYAKVVSGLTVNKVVNKENEADTLPADDIFEIVITPTTLEIENSISEFNGGSYNYTVDGGAVKTVTPVDGTSTTFGSLKVSIKAGQSINFSNLPVGSYSVKETTGANTNYIYDTDVHNVELEESKEVKVIFTNIYKQQQTSLTIRKTGAEAIDVNQTFLFHVVGDDVDLTVTTHGNGAVTITGLKAGGTYTITEITDWSWRYELDNVTTGLTNFESVTNGIKAKLSTNSDDNVITFSNKREKKQWLDGDSSCVNEFTGKNKTD
ncbi:MAG: hypothetical protein IJ439_04530 [Tyzzerella sp.]|nr:hypothetical protein [Tyzzerella sp.]